jgi:hypothetical protein
VNIASMQDIKTEKALGFLNCFRGLPFRNSLDFFVGRVLSSFTNHMSEVFDIVASKMPFLVVVSVCRVMQGGKE